MRAWPQPNFRTFLACSCCSRLRLLARLDTPTTQLSPGRCSSRENSASAGPTPFATLNGTGWYSTVPTKESENYTQLDERLHYTYGAIYTSPFIGSKKPGPGSEYVQAFKDKDGKRLDGGKSYRLHVPANVPAVAFWSLTLYDTATRSMLQNPSNDAAHSSYDKLKTNEDGAIDLYFGPQAPAGLESNWVETVLGKGFYPMFRFYTPKEGVFDGTWTLPDVEVMR